MPIVTIELRKQYAFERETQIIDAVHAEMMHGLKIPSWDKNIRLFVHEPHRFAAPPGKDERYALISIDLFVGRSLDAKKEFYQALATNLEPLGIPPDHVKVVLREASRENWGIGGLPASEIDLGFEVNV
jgi:phenylpyruvate tautomerase PptA (4-oxalocrotonate tautomerase family)